MLPLPEPSPQMAQSGLTAMFRSNGAAPAQCQMLAITDPSRVAMGAGPRPRAVGLNIYVFSRSTNMAAFTPVMNNLAASLAALPAPYPNVGGHSAAPVALANVPGPVSTASRVPAQRDHNAPSSGTQHVERHRIL